AIMVISSRISVGERMFAVETMREVKVVRLSPPSPLEKYSLWLWKKGKLDKEKELGDGGSILEPLVLKDKEIMNDNWQYYWHDATKRRFPLCIQKLSYYYRNVGEFVGQCYNDVTNTFSLSGLMMLGSSELDTKLKISGRIQGRGLLITKGVKVDVRPFNIHRDFLFSLADIGGNSITIRGFGSRLFEGLLYLPYGGLDVENNLEIKGFVYASDWNFSLKNKLQFDQERLEPPTYYVTMAEQTIKWVTRGETHDSSGPTAFAAGLHDN
ncbi:MAG: hypothetical protein QGH40_07570, partial [bacterium]|nr:hypothetical protein [bacterium]